MNKTYKLTAFSIVLMPICCFFCLNLFACRQKIDDNLKPPFYIEYEKEQVAKKQAKKDAKKNKKTQETHNENGKN